jgi:hypothetical protein
MKPRVFRTMPAFVFGWIWMAFAAANMVDLIVRGRNLAAVIAAAALLLGSGVAYVIGLRPRVVAADDGIRLHNPLHDIRLPWPAIDKIEATDALKVHSGERSFRAWALPASPRARARTEARSRRGRDPSVPDHVADYVKGRLPADFAAEQLTEMADEHRTAASDEAAASVSVSLSWPAAAALALPAALLAGSILLGVLG